MDLLEPGSLGFLIAVDNAKQKGFLTVVLPALFEVPYCFVGLFGCSRSHIDFPKNLDEKQLNKSVMLM